MKNIILLISFILYSSSCFSQSVTCQELKELIEKEAELESSTSCIGSTALIKAQFYTYEGEAYVIVYLKSSEYDYRGKPYIFCGISSSRWNKFVSEGRSGSWGKSFSANIKNNNCRCR